MPSKRNFRGILRLDLKIFSAQFELAQKPVEGRMLVLRISIIGHRMQPCFEEHIISVIVRVESTYPVMLFQQEYIGGISGKTYSGGQAGKAAADNDKRNFHKVMRL